MNYTRKHSPLDSDNIENKFMTYESSQINIIFNFHTYLCFTYVSTFMPDDGS
jgi:hypothetical protein